MRWRIACPTNTYVAAANITSSAPSVAVCQSASRARTDSNTRVLHGLGEHVPCPAPRLDQRRRTARVELATQPVDVHLEHVRPRIVVLVPHVLTDLGAAKHAPGVSREELEQRVLLRRERNEASRATRRLAS